MNRVESVTLVASLVLCLNASADEGVTIKDSAKIQNILTSISVVSAETGRMTLAERLAILAVNVQYVNYGKFDPDEIQASNGDIKSGDVDYQFFTGDVAGVQARCPVMTTFGLVKRGKSWLPETRTANFYMFNICKAPD